MIAAAHLAVTVLACYLGARLLARSTWPWHAPSVAIVCWQAIGLALGLAAIGLPLALGLAPYGEGTGRALLRLVADLAPGGAVPPVGPVHLALVAGGGAVAGVLLTATAHSTVGALRAQRRHRDLLTLVARDDPSAPGALVLDHPAAAAYCLPGMRPRVVVSAGTLNLLDDAELAAVLEHERAHARERHDLVLLPFTALHRALPGRRWLVEARQAVALLVEMRADDRARRAHADGPLARALQRFATVGSVTPSGALGAADRDLDVRLRRLLHPARPPRLRAAAALLMTATLVAVPVANFLA